MAVDIRVPPVVFKTRREIDEAPGFEWYDLSANEMFGKAKIGREEFRATSESDIPKDTKVKVTHAEGITLTVVPE